MYIVTCNNMRVYVYFRLRVFINVCMRVYACVSENIWK